MNEKNTSSMDMLSLFVFVCVLSAGAYMISKVFAPLFM
jgi:hypothetical protein